MKKINILQILSVYPWNAAANYAINLSEGLMSKGYNHKIVLPANVLAVPKANNLGINTVFMDLKSYNPLKLFRYAYTINRIVKTENINIINCHYAEAFLIACITKFIFRLKVPIVRTVVDIRKPKKNVINKVLLTKFASHFIISCSSSKDRYQSNFPELIDSKFSLIYYGHNINHFETNISSEEFRKKYKIKDSAFIVATIARLNPEKGHLFLLEIAKKVINKNRNIVFIIAGKEIDTKFCDLEEVMIQHNIRSNFIYIEHPKDVNEILSGCDIGLITSQSSEAACRIATEYMTYGKPIVSTNPNVLEEMIIDNKNGFINSINDVEKAAESILKLAEEKELYASISLNNYNEVREKYSLEHFTSQHIEIFEKLVN